jgi:hypothetical protein
MAFVMIIQSVKTFSLSPGDSLNFDLIRQSSQMTMQMLNFKMILEGTSAIENDNLESGLKQFSSGFLAIFSNEKLERMANYPLLELKFILEYILNNFNPAQMTLISCQPLK